MNYLFNLFTFNALIHISIHLAILEFNLLASNNSFVYIYLVLYCFYDFIDSLSLYFTIAFHLVF